MNWHMNPDAINARSKPPIRWLIIAMEPITVPKAYIVKGSSQVTLSVQFYYHLRNPEVFSIHAMYQFSLSKVETDLGSPLKRKQLKQSRNGCSVLLLKHHLHPVKEKVRVGFLTTAETREGTLPFLT